MVCSEAIYVGDAACNVTIGSSKHGNVSTIGWSGAGILKYGSPISHCSSTMSVTNVWIGFDLDGSLAPVMGIGIFASSSATSVTIGTDGDSMYPNYIGNCMDGIRSTGLTLGLRIFNTIIGISPLGRPAPNLIGGMNFQVEYKKSDKLETLAAFMNVSKGSTASVITVGSDGSATPVIISCNLRRQIFHESSPGDHIESGIGMDWVSSLNELRVTNTYVGLGLDGEMISCPDTNFSFWQTVVDNLDYNRNTAQQSYEGGPESNDAVAKFVEKYRNSADITVGSKVHFGTPNGVNKTYVSANTVMLSIDMRKLPSGTYTGIHSRTTVVTNTVFGQSKRGEVQKTSRGVIRILSEQVADDTGSISSTIARIGQIGAKPNVIRTSMADHADLLYTEGTYSQVAIDAESSHVIVENTHINADCRFGLRGWESSQYFRVGPNVTVQNASGVGILAEGANLVVINTSVSGSGIAGIQLSSTAAGAKVTGSSFFGNGWNPGGGIGGGAIIAAPGSTWINNSFGRHCSNKTDGSSSSTDTCQKSGNMFYGMWIKSGADNTAAIGNTVTESLWNGIRDDTDGHKLQSGGKSSSANGFNNQVDGTNGKGLAACVGAKLCLCTDIKGRPFATSVDCTGAAGLGSNFPSRLPQTTQQLNLRGVDLEQVEWSNLAVLKPGLTVLDLGDNPALDGLPASAKYLSADFPALIALNLRGTNMSRMGNNSFVELKNTLETLDVSSPSVDAPLNVVLNLTGFAKLRVLQTDRNVCPAGYYNSNPAYDTHFDGVVLCARCDPGTYKPVGNERCKPCSNSTRDHDRDPSTPCIDRLQFEVLSYRRGSTVYNNSESAGELNDRPVLHQLPYHVPTTIAGVDILRTVFKTGNVRFRVQDLPSGMLFDPANGYIEGVPLSKPAGLDGSVTLSAVLYAVDEASNNAVVEEMKFQVLYRDEDNPENGPFGAGCEHNGAVIDEIPFDKHFVCDCDFTAYTGSNCQVKRVRYTLMTPLMVGSLLAVGIGVVGWKAFRADVLRNGPHSFTKMIAVLERKSVLTMEEDDDLASISSDDDDLALFVGGSGDESGDDLLISYNSTKGADKTCTPTRSASKERIQSKSKGAFETFKLLPTLRRRRKQKSAATNKKMVRCKVPVEIPASKLEVLNPIGSGWSGEVSRGLLLGPTEARNQRFRWRGTITSSAIPRQQCAVKAVKRGSAPAVRTMLLEEAALMAQFKHPNVVELLGVVTRKEQCLLVLELCEKGSLFDLLRKEELHVANEETIRMDTVLNIASDVASGMNYMSGRNFVHRDLAARNILVDENLRCKVSDFGMSRLLAKSKYYYYMQNAGEGAGQFPLRWSAPEVLISGRFTSASDVWSFGMLVYEILTRAAYPFSGCANLRVIEVLSNSCDEVVMSRYMRKPFGCSRHLYQELVLPCWRASAAARPSFATFLTVVDELKAIDLEVSDEHWRGSPTFSDTISTSGNEYWRTADSGSSLGSLLQYSSSFGSSSGSSSRSGSGGGYLVGRPPLNHQRHAGRGDVAENASNLSSGSARNRSRYTMARPMQNQRSQGAALGLGVSPLAQERNYLADRDTQSSSGNGDEVGGSSIRSASVSPGSADTSL